MLIWNQELLSWRRGRRLRVERRSSCVHWSRLRSQNRVAHTYSEAREGCLCVAIAGWDDVLSSSGLNGRTRFRGLCRPDAVGELTRRSVRPRVSKERLGSCASPASSRFAC